MIEIEATRSVDRPPASVFDRIRDFEAYPSYSSYLEGVRPLDSDSALPAYGLEFGWWRLSFETRTRVVDLSPPERIEWEVMDDLDAHGFWAVSETGDGCELTLHVQYAPDSLGSEAVSLPFGISLGWVRERAETLIEAEAEQVLDRIAEAGDGDGTA